MNDLANRHLAHNVTHLAHMELTGAGQVTVEGGYAYLGHLTNAETLGTSILDIGDPRKPRLVSQIFLDDPNSHSHKARVVGDIMVANSEQNGTLVYCTWFAGALRIVDIADPSAPEEVGYFVPEPARDR